MQVVPLVETTWVQVVQVVQVVQADCDVGAGGL